MRGLKISGPVMAVAVGAAAVGGTGVGVAATKAPPSYKACATKSNQLVLLKDGKCPKATHGVSIGAQGPAGPQGLQGLQGGTGPKGDTGGQGIPGTANTVALHFTQVTAEQVPAHGTPTYHDVGSLDGVTVRTTCWEDNNFISSRSDVDLVTTFAGDVRAFGVFHGFSSDTPYITQHALTANTPTSGLFAIQIATGTVNDIYATFAVTGAGHATVTGTLFMVRSETDPNDCTVDGTLTETAAPTG